MAKKINDYQPPIVKVVEFMIERGFEFSGEKVNNVIPDFKSMAPSPKNNQYDYSNDWNSSFSINEQ